ncbi:hypothetical protein ABC733_22780 [Mangrovibacter sp. SLW1]
MKLRYQFITTGFITALVVGGLWSASHYYNKYQTEKLRADMVEGEVKSQAQVIARQAFNFNRFNQIAEYAGTLNSVISANDEKTVIKYREILRSEKTCDFPVPIDVAGGVLEYANRIRSSTMRADSGSPDATSDGAITTSSLTYCQAVLWLNPLLAAIDKANNQLAAIRQIEAERK